MDRTRTSPSGRQLSIAGGGYRAVVTECGAGLRSLAYDDRPLVCGYPEDRPASGGRGQLLLPWPNRIEDGTYDFEGRRLQLPITELPRGNAHHGLVRWAAWTPVEHTDSTVLLSYRLMAQPGYPWTLDLTAGYRLSDDGLTVTVTATNLADEVAPYALGAHPYLTVGEGPVDDWQLRLPARTRTIVDDRKIPRTREDVAGTAYDFRSGRAVGDLRLDDAFTDLERDGAGLAEAVVATRNGARTRLWMDRAHRWVQVYSGDDLPQEDRRRSLAVEPMTAPPNAFRTGEDLVLLAPYATGADTHTCSWGVRAG